MIGFIQYQKGNYAEARRELEACSDTAYEKFFWLAAIDFVEGKRDEAIQHLESLLEEGEAGIFFSTVRAMRCALKGELDTGKRILDETFSSGLQLGSYHFYIAAEVYAQLGDTASSLKMLSQAVQTGYSNYPFLMSDPLMAPVRQTDGFAEIAKAMQKLQTQLQLMLVTG
jgi:tetratricopeptide (TPR) repeat protein